MNFEAAERFILEKLDRELDERLYYHNAAHTREVVTACRQLLQMEKVDGRTAQIILTAALYHDTGMLIRYEDHESASVKILTETLPGFGYSGEEMDRVRELILDTREPRMARDLSEQILFDADLEALGREDFFIRSLCLQLEWSLYGIRKTTLREWFHSQVLFMEQHRYLTGSAQRLWQEQKQKNLEAVKELLNL
jgi:predicted metal-dependent HD superfamily phosphohydrolase